MINPVVQQARDAAALSLQQRESLEALQQSDPNGAKRDSIAAGPEQNDATRAALAAQKESQKQYSA